MIEATNNSIRSHDNLTERGDVVFWDNPTDLRETLKFVCLCDKSVGECFGALTREMNDTMSRRSSRGPETKSTCKP